MLDSLAMPRWVKQVEKAAKHRIGIWAIHNYIDANRFRTSGTRSLLRATKAKIWFTETGGLVRRDNGSKIEFADSPKHAVQATRWVLKLARLEPPRPARLLLPLDRARPQGHLGLGADRPARAPTPRLHGRAHVRAPDACGVAQARAARARR